MPSRLQTSPVSSVFHSVASCWASAHGVTNSASFLSSASYGSSVAGAPSGGGQGFNPRPPPVPRNAAGTRVCACAGEATSTTDKPARKRMKPAPTWGCLPDPGTVLLRFKGDGLAVGERHAEEKQLRLSITTRTSFERQLVAGLRHRAPPPFCFQLPGRWALDGPFLHRVAAAG